MCVAEDEADLVYAEVARGALRPLKLGRSTRVRRRDLEAYLSSIERLSGRRRLAHELEQQDGLLGGGQAGVEPHDGGQLLQRGG